VAPVANFGVQAYWKAAKAIIATSNDQTFFGWETLSTGCYIELDSGRQPDGSATEYGRLESRGGCKSRSKSIQWECTAFTGHSHSLTTSACRVPDRR
jgi:hypothetical protein